MAFPSSYVDLQTRVYAFYAQGEYRQAHDLMAAEAGQYPQNASMSYFWLACLAAMAGDRQQSLEYLVESLHAGYWYPPAQLRNETDLAGLQGDAEFERLVALCGDAEAAARTQSRPELEVLTPPAGAPQPYPLLMALHGNLSNIAESREFWAPAAARGWLVALPQSSLPGGADVYVWNDDELTARECTTHYEALRAQYPVAEGPLVLGGFSRGAEAAMWLALNGVLPAAAFIAVAPGGPRMRQPELWAPVIETRKAAPGLTGHIIAGEEDAGVLAASRALLDMLHDHCRECDLVVYPGLGHEFPPDFTEVLLRDLPRQPVA